MKNKQATKEQKKKKEEAEQTFLDETICHKVLRGFKVYRNTEIAQC